jgi:hypothetical protein
MNAITLFQPWATLAALGIKRFETRSWSTHYRGPLAIHAAKGMPRYAHAFADSPAVRYALRNVTLPLPRGAVVAVTYLSAVTKTELITAPELPLGLGDDVMLSQFLFGDFTPGRFAWTLKDTHALASPIPAAGYQKLWEWKCSTSFAISTSKA